MADENELYEKWREAPQEQRPELEQQLYKAVRGRVRAIVWGKLSEQNDALVHDIASTVIVQLPDFRGESRFSTWVHSIAEKQVALEIRERQSHRKVFDTNKEVLAESPSDAESTAAKHVIPVVEPRQYYDALLADIAKRLSPEDKHVLGAMKEGKEQNEIAKDLGISPRAAESRRRRLPGKVRKKYFRRGDG